MIGPAEAIAAEVLRHDPLAVALVILLIEWMTQSHYVDSVKDDADLDPLFKSLLKHHWMEEAQHAKLDTLMVEALAEGRDEAEIDSGDRRVPRDRPVPRQRPQGPGRAQPRRVRARDRPPAVGARTRARSKASSTRRCAGPISAPA